MKKIALLCLLFNSMILAQTTDPAKLADFQKRFNDAKNAINNQDYQKARQICESIIKEEPKAKGSLLIAGLASLELFESSRALEHLEAFRKLEPNDPQGILFLIQASQAEKKTPKVEALLKELLEMRKSSTKLQATPSFIRERFKTETNRIVIVTQYYDWKIPPYKLWEVSEVDPKTEQKTRSMDFSYNVGASEGLKKGEAYFFGEIAFKDGLAKQINIYREEKNIPDYSVFRKWATDTLKEPPKPIYSTPFEAKKYRPMTHQKNFFYINKKKVLYKSQGSIILELIL